MTDLAAAYALLGLQPGADADAVSAAYRRRAKALHPDRTGEEADAERMAAVNAAHEVLTAALLGGVPPATGAATPAQAPPRPAARPSTPGHWLGADVRRSLGAELLTELSDGEAVHAVVRTSTWASPHTVLAVTDRRLLWLLDDAVAGRVRWLRFGQIADVRVTTRGRRNRTARLRVRPRSGRPVTFADLAEPLAHDLAERIGAAAAG